MAFASGMNENAINCLKESEKIFKMIRINEN